MALGWQDSQLHQAELRGHKVWCPAHHLLLCSTPSRPSPPVAPATGYALAAFIPISFVCIFPIELMRWIVVGVATLTSGTFIMLSLRK